MEIIKTKIINQKDMDKIKYEFIKKRIEIKYKVTIELGYKKYKFFKNSMDDDADICDVEFNNKLECIYNKKYCPLMKSDKSFYKYFMEEIYMSINIPNIMKKTLLIYYDKMYSVYSSHNENIQKLTRINRYIKFLDNEYRTVPSLLESCIYVINQFITMDLNHVLPSELIDKIENYKL